MGIDLRQRQRTEHQDQGKVTGADGRGYTRRGTKTKRSVADKLIHSGAPLVLEMYSTGQFEWFEGAEARTKWDEVREFVISTAPTSSSCPSTGTGTPGSGRTRTAISCCT